MNLPQLPPVDLSSYSPLSRPSSCTLCPLHTVATTVGVPTVSLLSSLPPSPSTPAVLLLGQNPGLQEDRAGLPFIGPSGRLVHSVYMDGISLRSLATVYLSNTARCFHLEGEGPPAKSYKTCLSAYLPLDLSSIPSLSLTILTLGAPAATHLYALAGVPKATLTYALSHQASYLTIGSRSFHVFSTYHPAAILRMHNLIHAVQGHLQLLLDHLVGAYPQVTTPVFIRPRSPGEPPCLIPPPALSPGNTASTKADL